jgi:hypothetical protein
MQLFVRGTVHSGENTSEGLPSGLPLACSARLAPDQEKVSFTNATTQSSFTAVPFNGEYVWDHNFEIHVAVPNGSHWPRLEVDLTSPACGLVGITSGHLPFTPGWHELVWPVSSFVGSVSRSDRFRLFYKHATKGDGVDRMTDFSTGSGEIVMRMYIVHRRI